ncbi:TB2 DP1 HVA22 family integral membrane protein [Cryptosporidium ubiquitum]|uniref:TB2 DP1 HVA22 family integral membrane protein n=1 Tax=Cryptosporidium ubiquitum TaxID=857276 RepID=A0A1J4MK64_9CRYT|nr:TB2 DP1 HVA22 family integral membrane protein [Cryptosporidium ubiquitum]OII74625.1 TB2 DP1 HVA22 family integral membrane protein [Cryptosporidium ubiquitum]
MANKWRMLNSNKNPESLSVFSGLNIDLETYCKEIDGKLANISWVKSVSESFGCRPCYLMFGGVSILVLIVSMGYAGALICNLVGFIYPAYMSFKALETPGKLDDKQWLTYWVVYAIFNILEVFIDIILFWMPFYYLFKLCFLFWLFLPQTTGAVMLYNNIFRPLLIRFEKKIDITIENVLDVSNSARLVAQRYSKKLLEGSEKIE